MGLKEGWERFKAEVGQTLVDKFHQGRDELANAIFHGSSYMPWPGREPQTAMQEAERAVEVAGIVEQIRGQTVIEQGADQTLTYDPVQFARGQGKDDERGIER